MPMPQALRKQYMGGNAPQAQQQAPAPQATPPAPQAQAPAPQGVVTPAANPFLPPAPQAQAQQGQVPQGQATQVPAPQEGHAPTATASQYLQDAQVNTPAPQQAAPAPTLQQQYIPNPAFVDNHLNPPTQQQQPIQQQQQQQQVANPPPEENKFDFGVKMPDSVQYQLDQQEQTTYQAALPVIEKVVKSYMDAQTAQVNSQLSKIGTSLGELEQGVTGATLAATDTFDTMVMGDNPDLNQLRANPQWKDFLGSSIRGTTLTVAESLSMAQEGKDTNTINTLLSDFRTMAGGQTQSAPMAQQPQAPAVPNNSVATTMYDSMQVGPTNPVVNNQTVPQTAAADNYGENLTPAQKPQLKLSMRQRASKDYAMGRLNQADLRVIDQEFRLADAEGRVDYNS